MRKDESGGPCPATLGEYRDLVFALMMRDPENDAVKFLDRRIAQASQGRETLVVLSDAQMRVILFDMMKRGMDRGHP